MTKLSDEELIEELQCRFSQNKKSLKALSKLTRQLLQVNQKLKESEKLKSQFLSNIRNEINNPLASIIGLSKSIESISGAQSEKITSMASLIHTEAFNLDFQLKNIFAAAELESGESTPEIAQVDIVSLVSSVIDIHQHRIQAKRLQVKVTRKKLSALSAFKTDPAKLQLILSNLLANAIEYSHTDRQLNIQVWKQDNIFSLSIQDFGIGIQQADQERIFNRFIQLNSGTTRPYRGHGLGLSVTKALLEILKGKIELTSNKGEGSTFVIHIAEFEGVRDNLATNGNELLFEEDERF